jgi:histidine triad (HIT) family protein
MNDCIFCKIASGQISAKKVFEDDSLVAFHDISPKAPVHVLVIPKVHIASVNEINDIDDSFVGKILKLMPQLAEMLEVKTSGYRVVINCGENGGQSVDHLHFHLIGGRALTWPPG